MPRQTYSQPFEEGRFSELHHAPDVQPRLPAGQLDQAVVLDEVEHVGHRHARVVHLRVHGVHVAGLAGGQHGLLLRDGGRLAERVVHVQLEAHAAHLGARLAVLPLARLDVWGQEEAAG